MSSPSTIFVPTAFVPTAATQTALFLVKATPALSLIIVTACTLKGLVW